ncbi:MAG: T9SS type A sorting domain-containing protein [Bacteroidetes bacterium]|nr:T9SS type A sorting domain-containing protein [Bacteroidota bacterium]
MRNSGGGDISFNSDGTKMTVSDWGNLIELYDFDRCTGTISNATNIELPNTSGGPYKYYISLCFSPNDQFLYVMSCLSIDDATIFQFDLTASSIPNSKLIIGTIKDSASTAMMKLGPDNKIYISSWSRYIGNAYPYPAGHYNPVNTALTVINQPDSLGSACDFQLFSFPLGGHRTYRGLPHNPNYEMGACVGSPCDTLSVGVDDNVPEQQVFFQAWYNSEWNMIHVSASKLKGRKGSLRLFDLEGRLVYEKRVEVIAGGYVTGEIPMNEVANGVYFVNLITDSESVSSKLVKF